MELSAGTQRPVGLRLPRVASVPTLLEGLAVLAAIVLLLPAFAQVAQLGAGRDDRFRPEPGFAIADLPAPVLPELCPAHAAFADPSVAEPLCDSIGARRALLPPAGASTLLLQRLQGATDAFLRPVQQAELRLQRLRVQAERADAAAQLAGGDALAAARADGSVTASQASARSADASADGAADASAEIADAIAAIEADIQPYLERFQLVRSGSAGPVPLQCAMHWARTALADAAQRGAGDQRSVAARANAVLLLGAALDGRAATGAIAAGAALPTALEAPVSACRAGAAAAISDSAALMADARESLSNARKNEAMRDLFASAGWQWAAAMALGYALLLGSRRANAPALGVAAALATWAGAAWLARVPWPLAAQREFEPARLEASWASPPAPFVLVLLGAAAVLLLASLFRGERAVPSRRLPPQSMSSRIGYAGLVLATGIGSLLLLDLSSQGLHANRYLALYHQGHLWLGMLVLSVLLFVRQPLSRALAWLLSVGGEAVHRTVRRVGRAGALGALLLLTLGVLAVFALGLSNLRQLTSELGRVWLIVGAAWFFFLRAGPLTDRLARHGPTGASFLRYAWPLLFVVAVLVAAMLITRDMGPLLIAGYASGAFLAASLAMWWHRRSGQRLSAFALAFLVFAAWIAAATLVLLRAGAVDAVTASRLESMAAPFASINDQLALVSWFRAAAPSEGFGIGTTPWCGFVSAGACSGVPAQIHSDYTFTAIAGVFGSTAAWAVSIGMAVWLHRLVRHHGRVTRGEPQLLAVGAQIGNDGQALLSWLAIAWVVLTSCQLAVTVAGNLAVLPLTGVTFPFVSFGMTSLLVNMALLGLCLNVDVPSRGAGHG